MSEEADFNFNKYQTLQELHNSIEVRPTLDSLHILDTKDIAETQTNSRTLSAERYYRIGKANLTNTDQSFTIIDPDFKIEEDTAQTVCVQSLHKREVSDSEEYPRTESWLDEELRGELVKIVPFIDTNEFFEQLQNMEEINWEDFIYMLADDTDSKDRRIMQMGLFSQIELPKNSQLQKFYQSTNGHMIIATQTGTGKSTMWERLTGNEPSSDWTQAGLIGSVDMGEGLTIKGDLHGQGAHVFDEFPEKDGKDVGIMKHLLNYMESGQTTRSTHRTVRCEGTKNLVFLGNLPFDEVSERSFQHLLSKLGGDGPKDRLGRRIGHILYGNDFNEVNPGPESKAAVQFLRNSLQTLTNQNTQKIKLLLEWTVDWVSQEDDDYTDTIRDYTTYAEDETRSFLNAHARATSRIKMSALRLAIIENLPQINQTDELRDLWSDTITSQAVRNYQNFKEYNINSIEFLLENDKKYAMQEFEKGKSPSQVQERFAASKSKLEKWYEEHKKEKDPEELDKNDQLQQAISDYQEGIEKEQVLDVYDEVDEEELEENLD